MTGAELQRQGTETKKAHLERLKGLLIERRADAQAALAMKRHLEESYRVMVQSRASRQAVTEVARALQQACTRLGVARGMVDITEAHYVTALNG